MSSLSTSVVAMLYRTRGDTTQIPAILTPDNLEEIQNGYQLTEVIRVLISQGGRAFIDQVLKTPGVLGKIQNGHELSVLILELGEARRGDLAEEILTPEVLNKIQNTSELNGVIRVLNWSMPIVDRVLRTPGVLDKIQNGSDIAGLISKLYQERLGAIADQILTPAVLDRIQSRAELFNVTFQLSLYSHPLTVERRSELIVKVLTTPSIAERFPFDAALDSSQFATSVVRTAVQELIESSRRWDRKSSWVSAVVRATHRRFGTGVAAPVALPATAMAFGGLGGGGSAGVADPVVEASSGGT